LSTGAGRGPSRALVAEERRERMTIETAIAALIAGLTLTVVHLLAVWGSGGLRWLSRPPQSYVMGVAILGAPYVVLLLMRGEQRSIIDFAVIIVGGGLPVIVGHFFKKFQVLQRENAILRGGLRENEQRELARLERQETRAGRESSGTRRVD